jgi:hypothetical protein
MDLLLGNLFQRWNIVKERDLASALQISEQVDLPLGKSLIALNLISAYDLKNAVQLQSMLRDGILSIDEGDRAMRFCRTERITLGQSLNRAGLISASGVRVRLGRLLLESDCIESDDLSRNLSISQTTNLPLGMVLINNHTINQATLDSLIEIQKLVRTKSLKSTDAEFKDVVAQLHRCKRSSTVFDTRIGNLLLLAGVISDEELTTAIEMSSANQKLLGELLVEFGWITENTLAASVELQGALRQGLTDIETTAKVLGTVHTTQRDVDTVFRESTPAFTKKLLLGKFLIIAGFIDHQELRTACHNFVPDVDSFDPEPYALIEKIMCVDPFVVQDVVCKSGLVNENTATAAYKYWQLARHGLIPLVKAIVLFADYVARGG